mgnify:CR=1 FL=1
MRIALPSIWFHRGQTVVTQTLARALRELGHEVFIHGRMGGVYGLPKQEPVRWGWEPVTYWPEYDLKPTLGAFIAKLHEQLIDIVLFNEEYDWELVAAIKEEGFRIATYLDYLHKDWLGPNSPLKLYDLIFCSTKRSYLLMPDKNRRYIGWGIPEDSVIQRTIDQRSYLFFENIGWMGINDRKGLGTLLECYKGLLKDYPQLAGSLLIQAQIEIDTDQRRHLFCGIDVMSGCMNQPGLYHMAEVYCYPAILDGLGLSLLEAIASGCAVICPDAPPWNEFVEHERNGLLVPITHERQREDGIAFPEVFVDQDAWVEAMERLAMDSGLRRKLAAGSLDIWKERLDWADFVGRIEGAVEGGPRP